MTGLRVQGMPVYHLFSSVVVVGVEDRSTTALMPLDAFEAVTPLG